MASSDPSVRSESDLQMVNSEAEETENVNLQSIDAIRDILAFEAVETSSEADQPVGRLRGLFSSLIQFRSKRDSPIETSQKLLDEREERIQTLLSAERAVRRGREQDFKSATASFVAATKNFQRIYGSSNLKVARVLLYLGNAIY